MWNADIPVANVMLLFLIAKRRGVKVEGIRSYELEVRSYELRIDGRRSSVPLDNTAQVCHYALGFAACFARIVNYEL